MKASLSVLLLLSIMICLSYSEIPKKYVQFQGQPCHGGNVFNSKPLSTYDKIRQTFSPTTNAFWSNFIQRELGWKTPDGGAGPITDETPLDALAAFWLSPEVFETMMLDNFNLSVIPQSRYNNTIGQVWTFPSRTSATPVPFPKPSEVPKFARSLDVKDMTIREWNRADGVITLRCDPVKKTGRVEIKASGLIPFYLYSIWAVGAFTDGTSTIFGSLWGVQMGGTPALMVPNEKGEGTWAKDLLFCPTDIYNPIMYVAALAHYDAIMWGTASQGVWNPAPWSICDHLCFAVGDHLLDDD